MLFYMLWCSPLMLSNTQMRSMTSIWQILWVPCLTVQFYGTYSILCSYHNVAIFCATQTVFYSLYQVVILGSPLASSARVVLKGIFVYGPLEVLNCLLLMLELINHSIESHFFFLEEDILLFLCGLMTTQVTLLHPWEVFFRH